MEFLQRLNENQVKKSTGLGKLAAINPVPAAAQPTHSKAIELTVRLKYIKTFRGLQKCFNYM